MCPCVNRRLFARFPGFDAETETPICSAGRPCHILDRVPIGSVLETRNRNATAARNLNPLRRLKKPQRHCLRNVVNDFRAARGMAVLAASGGLRRGNMAVFRRIFL